MAPHRHPDSGADIGKMTEELATEEDCRRCTLDKMRLEDFQMGRLLGEGNFSKTYAAEIKATGERVALKVVDLKQLEINKKCREALMEKHCLMRLNRSSYRDKNAHCIFSKLHTHQADPDNEIPHHGKEHVIKLFHTFKTDFELCFVTELCEGEELWDRIRFIGLHENTTRWYISQILTAMEYTHSKNIVHRDIKAENLVVHTPTQQLKLLDFGSAIDLNLPAELTVAGNSRKSRFKNDDREKPGFLYFVGTPNFMAPEAQSNKVIKDCSSDIYSFGGLIYQMITGAPPFAAPSEFLTFVRANMIDLDIPCYMSRAAEDCIRLCMSHEPKDRPGLDAIWEMVFLDDSSKNCRCSLPAPQLDKIEQMYLSRKAFYREFVKQEFLNLAPHLAPPTETEDGQKPGVDSKETSPNIHHPENVNPPSDFEKPHWVDSFYPGRLPTLLQGGSACRRAAPWFDWLLMTPGEKLWLIIWDRIRFSLRHMYPNDESLEGEILQIRDCKTNDALVVMFKISLVKRRALDGFVRIAFECLRQLSTGSRNDLYYDHISAKWLRQRSELASSENPAAGMM